eukprot:14767.XXX_600901_600656_1 [CDS] Oithona nana genome sequencing.
MTSELNPEGQTIKRGSFEITVTTEDGKSETIWSGVKLGPPRKLKFPDSKELLGVVKKFLE